MPVLHDEVPDDDFSDIGSFDSDSDSPVLSHRHDDDVNMPGWLSDKQITWIRHRMPIPYIIVLPVRLDAMSRVERIGLLLHMNSEGNVERSLIAGRVLFHESLREAIMRLISHDMGELTLPTLPVSLEPSTIAEIFPTPGIGDGYDRRQHAIALCYMVPVSGDINPQKDTLDVEWFEPSSIALSDALDQMVQAHASIVKRMISQVCFS